MNHAQFLITLREDTNLPINVLASEGRMKILEHLAPFMDVVNVVYVPDPKTTTKE